jgi:hypothetical protein
MPCGGATVSILCPNCGCGEEEEEPCCTDPPDELNYLFWGSGTCAWENSAGTMIPDAAAFLCGSEATLVWRSNSCTAAPGKFCIGGTPAELCCHDGVWTFLFQIPTQLPVYTIPMTLISCDPFALSGSAYFASPELDFCTNQNFNVEIWGPGGDALFAMSSPEEMMLAPMLAKSGVSSDAIASQGMLAGDVIEAMTRAIGIVPCGSCQQRKAWINAGHQWLRNRFGFA